MQLVKQVMWAYAARDYTPENPRTTNVVEVNVPEALPTIPQDDKVNKISLSNAYFVNSNYPKVPPSVSSTHYYTIPLLNGTSCPTEFSKGTRFMLISPTERLEESYLIFA